jgi:Do/DeqQ family serine protease
MVARPWLPALVLALSLASGWALTAAQAEEVGPSLRDTLSSLLGAGGADRTPVGQEQRRVPFGREDMQLSFAPLVKETAPAVVNVYASQQVQYRSPFMGDPFFERFFDRQVPPRVQSSLGSGVLVDPSGIVVTNHHVIQNADEVKVALSDGREFESTILLKDETLDLAVLKILSREPFPAIPVGDSDALEVGDLVLAIGNPFGVGQTTTSGIVSALARNHIGVSDFGFFIQTDAAINPGNSGGALIDMAGRLVGINTAIYSRTGGSIGIGFAIPSNIVRTAVDAARNGLDHLERPFIGASFEPVTPDLAEALGMTTPAGALVSRVDRDSPAAAAGLEPGDVVLALNETAIQHPDAFGYRLALQPIGSEVGLKILRQGRERNLKIRLEREPARTSARQILIDGGSPFAGAKVAGLSPRLARHLRLPANATGVAVIDVARGSPAANFGIRPRDIIREVNGQEITDAVTLQHVATQKTRWWKFTIERDRRILRQTLRY